jgi:stage II sporulation protein D
VEYVDINEYVYGVLPREVDPSWPIEALKAQAIVSRTYALSNRLAATQERFDLSSSVLDQVYGGMEVESPLSNQAVDDTRGQVLEDSSGKPVQAFFHSSCGGQTELPSRVWKSSNADEVFGSVPDNFCNADPHYKWQWTASYSVIRKRLRHVGLRVREIKKIVAVQKSESGRTEVFGVVTSQGTTNVWGNQFRLAMGPEALRSTMIINMKAGKSSVSFEGHGWGHGVGLCQWGARGRALAGQSCGQILQTYYPKAKLTRLS